MQRLRAQRFNTKLLLVSDFLLKKCRGKGITFDGVSNAKVKVSAACDFPRLSFSPRPQFNLLSTCFDLLPMPFEPENVVDLRSLQYVGTVNANLICCICQVPFIDPVVLPCGYVPIARLLTLWNS